MKVKPASHIPPTNLRRSRRLQRITDNVRSICDGSSTYSNWGEMQIELAQLSTNPSVNMELWENRGVFFHLFTTTLLTKRKYIYIVHYPTYTTYKDIQYTTLKHCKSCTICSYLRVLYILFFVFLNFLNGEKPLPIKV